jgi:hypothetical protein
MRHRIGMILAAKMTRVLFFPEAWVPAALALPAPAGQLSQLPGADGGRRPRVASCDADGLAHDQCGVRRTAGFGECNGCPASGVLPVWPMFLQHRRRCVSTVRWRASLTNLAGVVLIAAEGRAS